MLGGIMLAANQFENRPEIKENSNILSTTGQKKGFMDGNVSECSICGEAGKLISCDDCPGAFHAECLGYTKQCPRGKWKCYFCKVTTHGIPNKVARMAPNEKPICDILAETNCPNWEIKASQLFDVLEDYFSAKAFCEPLNLTE